MLVTLLCGMATKECKKCGFPKDILLFGKDPKNSDGRRGTCKECVRKHREETTITNRSRGLCLCGRKLSHGFKTCDTCQDFARERMRRLKKNNPDAIVRQRTNERRRARDLKLAAFDAYGGRQCSCCGESHVEFLTIDHITPVADTKPKRTRFGSRNGERRAPPPLERNDRGHGLYRWLMRNGYPAGFRVLCMNCNWARGKLGRCPHESERSVLDSDATTKNGVLACPAVLAPDTSN